MYEKKILICDYQRYISRFLKYELGETFTFDIYKNFDLLNNEVFENYSIIVFVIYSEIELFDLIRVYKKKIPLIVCTFNNRLFLKFEKLDDILLINAGRTRPELVLELNYYFEALISNKSDLKRKFKQLNVYKKQN